MHFIFFFERIKRKECEDPKRRIFENVSGLVGCLNLNIIIMFENKVKRPSQRANTSKVHLSQFSRQAKKS